MSATASSEFVRAMGPVAREILGEPTEENKTKRELRYGTRGSLKISLATGTWFDNEAGKGGGVLDFVQDRKGLDRDGAIVWLQERGHIPKSDEPKPGGKRIVATYDYTNADGELLFQVVRYEPKDFRQRRPDGNGGWIWKMTGVQRVLYRMPEVIAAAAAGRTVFVAEGENGVAAIERLSFTGTCSPGGAGKWRAEYSPWLRDADVVLLPDNDDAGRKHVEQVAGFLRGIAGRVRVLALPGLPERGDIADWVADGGTDKALAELAEDAPGANAAHPQTKPRLAPNQPPLRPDPSLQQDDPQPAKDGEEQGQRDHADRPIILLKPGALHLITTAAESAIIELGLPIFQRGPSLVRPAVWEVPAIQGRTALAAGLSTLKAPAIIDALSAVANFQRFDVRTDRYAQANPPDKVADILLSRYGLWNLPTIAGVITTPTLRPDGSILSAPGYDPQTRLYHAADTAVKLDAAVYNPTRADAERALTLLLDLLVDFPFVIAKAEGKPDRHLSRAVALSALITPVVRGGLPVAPMHGFRANAPGTGKSYLTDTISAIATGQPCPVMSAAPDDPKETEKRLIGMLLAGLSIICLDNVNGELGGDTLAQAIERPLLRLRPLGGSDMIMIESRATILANGNQLTVRDDMLRRTLTADLDAEVERPETRIFAGDPVANVLENRGRYVSAALIIVRAYLAAGSPGCLPPLASFGRWSDLVRSALVWLGCDDPVEVMEQSRADDPGLAELQEVMSLWDHTFATAAVTIKAVVNEATQTRIEADEEGDIPLHGGKRVPCHPDLLDALIRVSGGRGAIDSNKLAYWMRKNAKRIVGKRRFINDGNTHGSARWKLTEINR